jgi:putative transposase
MRQRVARSRELIAEGHSPSAVARVAQISRQALYRVPTPRTLPQRRPPADPVEAAIVAEALANQTDGYRMVTAFVRRRLGVAVNRKRVLRVMREHKLIQRRRPLQRRRRPGFFRVERPHQLWQLDMTSVWVAEHGWCYLNAVIDCCTREIVAWQLELRCRADEAIQVGRDGLSWPHHDGLIWPHPCPTAGRPSELHRARAGGRRRDGIESGAVRADP